MYHFKSSYKLRVKCRDTWGASIVFFTRTDLSVSVTKHHSNLLACFVVVVINVYFEIVRESQEVAEMVEKPHVSAT